MKKKKLIALLALFCSAGLTAAVSGCGHEHTFSDKWSQSETEHWHEAACEHAGEKADIAPHTDNNRDEKCDECGFSMHVHKFSDGWESDNTGHWHPATCSHSDAKDGFAKHTDGNNDGKCDECEYEPIDVTVGGTYYYYENGEADNELYVVFKNGKWSDDNGLSGDYTVFGNTVTLYTVILNEKTDYADGTVSGENITLNILGADVTYKKGENLPDTPTEKTLSFALGSDGSYYVVKGIGGLSGDIVIPDEWKRKPVKEIAEGAFKNCTALTGVTIGANVEKIGKQAFSECTALTEAVLGGKVEKIEESTFEKCKKLSSVTIPASVKSIADKSFSGCTALENIYFTGTASEWAVIDFYYSVGSYSSTIANPLYSSGGKRKLYIDDELLTVADLSSATEVKPTAFYGCTQLKSVKTGENTAVIGEYAFYGCTALTSVTLESGLCGIEKSAFSRCSALASVTVPDTASGIGDGAFNECENLVSANTGNGVSNIGYGAFMACAKLVSLTLGTSVAEIGECAFYSCNALESVTIPTSAIFIGKEAFRYTALNSATFESTSGWIANKQDALTDAQLSNTANAARLLTVSILDKGYAEADIEKTQLQYTLSSDGSYYILNNSGTVTRSELVIPEKYKDKPVRALSQDAFRNCRMLKSISLPGCMKNIPTSAFNGCISLENIEIRGYLVSDYEEVYASSDGVLYDADFSKLLFIPAAKREITVSGSVSAEAFAGNLSVKKVIIANGAKYIGNSAFSGCKNLTSVVIPDSVTKIEDYAFYGCESLTSVSFGKGLETVGHPIFENCEKLTEVSVADGISNYGLSALLSQVIIDNGWADNVNLKDVINYNEYSGALYLGNEKNPFVALVKSKDKEIKTARIHKDAKLILNDAFFDCHKLEKAVLPNGLTSIGKHAFYNCKNLKTVSLPDGITEIGEYAFSGCENLSFNRDGKWLYLGNANNPFVALIEAESETVTACNLHKDAKIIASGALSGCYDLTEITIPDGIENIPVSSLKISSLEKITVGENNAVYTSLDGILYNKDKTEIILVPAAIKGEITVPETVTDLGAHFAERKYITSVIIPDSVTVIETEAFQNCTALESIQLPENLTEIKAGAFYNCTALTGVHISDLVKWCSVKFGDNPLIYAHNLFIDGEAVVNLPIPSQVAAISANAFSGASFESVTIPSSVKTIGKGAFKNCADLSVLTVNSGITAIEESAFEGCTALTEIALPESITKIDFKAFKGCTALEKVRINDLEKWCNIAFGHDVFEPYSLYLKGKILTDLVVPDGMTQMKSYAFANCISLKSASVPASVTSYGYSVFGNCTSLESITVPFVHHFGYWFGGSSTWGDNSQYIPESLKTVVLTGGLKNASINEIYLRENAFLNCKHIENVILPYNLTHIYNNAFKGCDSLSSLTLPFVGERVDGSGEMNFKFIFGNYVSDVPKTLKNVTIKGGAIANKAFYGCSSIENMEICDSVKSIGQNAFMNCNFKNLTIANGVKNIDENALVFAKCENLTVHADVLTAVYGKSPSVISSTLKTLTITGGAAKGYHSTNGDPTCGLRHCTNLTKVVFKSGVTSIGDRMFDMSNCPNNSLSEIVIEEGVISIGEYTFMDCSKLESITLPDSVTKIGHAAFSNCSGLKTVTVGKNLKTIDYGAFMGCADITDINYNGTKSQWNAVTKDSSWINYSAKYTVHCTDGDIAKK